jgi:parvulin-like peptidyl-prolyl isomerase
MSLLRRVRTSIQSRFEAADKSVLTNIAFLSAIVLSGLLLVGVALSAWWSDNLASAVEVNGQSVTVSEARARANIEYFRLGIEEQRIRARVSAGTLSNEAGTAALQSISDRGDNLSSAITSDLIDMLLIRDLAGSNGVSIDDADVEAKWQEEQQIPELRLLRRITIDFTPIDDAAAEADAKAKADAILAELRAGAVFSDVAKRESTDSFAVEGGRIGWSTRAGDPLTDPAYEAAWSLTSPGTTDVILQDTGAYVIFYVEQIREATLDANFSLLASENSVDLALYRKVIGETLLRDALREKVTADLLKSPVEQRDVSYVSVPVASGGGEVEEVHVSHILYSPNDDAQGASKLSESDPAWAAAKADADAGLLLVNQGKNFESIAMKYSDDDSSAQDGGLLAWAPQGTFVTAFENAIWDKGLQVGEIVGPIKTEFGYHIIRLEGRRSGVKLAMEALSVALKDAGEDFIKVATDAVAEYSGTDVQQIGFLSRYTINPDLSKLIWALGAGEVSNSETINDQLIILRVNAIEERELDASQKSAITQGGFDVWLTLYSRAAAISIEGKQVQEAGESPAP